MKEFIRKILNKTTMPLWRKKQAKEWQDIAEARGDILDATTEVIHKLNHKISYLETIVAGHDDVLAINVRDMRQAQRERDIWKHDFANALDFLDSLGYDEADIESYVEEKSDEV